MANIETIIESVIEKAFINDTCSSNNDCSSCKHKDDCKSINQFIRDIKDKGLSKEQFVRAISLYVYAIKEQKYVAAFGKTKESIIKYAISEEFELDWLIKRWDSIIEDKDKLKDVIAILPQYVKDMINTIVDKQSVINHTIAEYLMDTSSEEVVEIGRMFNPVQDNSYNKLKNFTEDELMEELKRRNEEQINTK